MIDGDDGIWVDLFCGGGGASTGIRAARGGRSPEICVDLWPVGLSVHESNHPEALHLLSDAWAVRPKIVVGSRRVRGLWLSPPCTDFSNANSTGEKSSKKRSLAWLAVYWARQVRPEIIIMENVVGMLKWGPLDQENKPIKKLEGKSFKIFVRKLEKLGYTVETKTLCAADHGAPTRRTRMFLIARCDGKPIVWPTPTHGPGTERPHRGAHEVIRWDVEGKSIFGRAKPLVPATLRRIATGLQRFVLDDANPCVIELPSGTMIGSVVQRGYTDRPGQASRSKDARAPFDAIVSSAIKNAVVTAHLDSAYGTSRGQDAKDPLPSITTDGGGKVSIVTTSLSAPWVQKHQATSIGVPIHEPFHVLAANSSTRQKRWDSAPVSLVDTVVVESDSVPAATAAIEGFIREHRTLYKHQPADHPCVPSVLVGDRRFWIVDVKMRMLLVEELLLGQGFPRSYKTSLASGEPAKGTDLVTIAGNAVCPPMAAALVAAQLGVPFDGSIA